MLPFGDLKVNISLVKCRFKTELLESRQFLKRSNMHTLMYELLYFIHCDLNFSTAKIVHHHHHHYHGHHHHHHHGWWHHGRRSMDDKKRKADEKDIEENDERKLME